MIIIEVEEGEVDLERLRIIIIMVPGASAVSMGLADGEKSIGASESALWCKN